MAYQTKQVRFADTVHMFDRSRPPALRLWIDRVAQGCLVPWARERRRRAPGMDAARRERGTEARAAERGRVPRCLL